MQSPVSRAGMMEEGKPTMQEHDADNVQGEANASHDQDQFWLLNPLEGYESLDGLEEYANAQCEQEHAIEKGPEQLGSLPSEGQVLRGFATFRDLVGSC